MKIISKKKKILISIIVVLIFFVFCFYILQILNNNKKDLTKEIIKNQEISSMFAIMLEQGDGTYKESDKREWPSSDYIYNKEKSGCIDSSGNIIRSSLNYNEALKTVSLRTSKAVGCFLYFDQNGIKEGTIGYSIYNTDNTNINYAGGLYRYQGKRIEVTNNYICFGTSDLVECAGDTDKYMYRIIGITSDGKLKLVKDEELSTKYKWHNSNNTNTSWADSDLYKGLNGIDGGTYSNIFVNNTEYSYVEKTSKWYNKIATMDWKYGDNKTDLSNFNFTGDGMYAVEGSWTNIVNAKIGLLKTHDIFYAYKGGAPGSMENAVTSWIVTENKNWTMSRYGLDFICYYAWTFNTDSISGTSTMSGDTAYVRPVFYVRAEEELSGGRGTIDSPYTIKSEEVIYTGKDLVNNPTDGLNTTEEGGMYRYQGTHADNFICFGTTDVAECMSNPRTYMYRIIGITPEGQLKLIKYTAIYGENGWYGYYTALKSWDMSDLYRGLNGISGWYNNCTIPTDSLCTGYSENLYFIGNDTYSYMASNSDWYNKIAEVSWKLYGSVSTYVSNAIGSWVSSLPTTAQGVYELENNFTNTTSAKIGLMYLHDYYYAYQSGGLDCANSNHKNACKSSWLHLSKNDTENSAATEFTILSSGVCASDKEYQCYYLINSDGAVENGKNSNYPVRPVFYLNSDVEFTGDGSYVNPFIIKME